MYNSVINKISIAESHPWFIAEWDFENNELKPDEVSRGSNSSIGWVCALNDGHKWRDTIANRVRGRGCKFCSGKIVHEGNALKSRFPELLEEWDWLKNLPLRPENVSYGSDKLVWWKCDASHGWKATVSSRTIKKTGCP